MDTSQMCEQFESQFIEEYVRVLGEGARDLAAHALAANSAVVSISWWAWQASSASMVVELQSKKHSVECRLEVSQDTLSTIRGCLRATEDDIDRLKAENEALRKDAERYRWLNRQRAQAWKEVAEIPMNYTDAHIDAAMAKEVEPCV